MCYCVEGGCSTVHHIKCDLLSIIESYFYTVILSILTIIIKRELESEDRDVLYMELLHARLESELRKNINQNVSLCQM